MLSNIMAKRCVFKGQARADFAPGKERLQSPGRTNRNWPGSVADRSKQSAEEKTADVDTVC